MDIARDMGRTNFLDTKRTSGYELYDRVGKMLVRFKYDMGRINTIPQYGTGKDSGKRAVTYMDSGMILKGTQDTIIYLLEASGAYFVSPRNGAWVPGITVREIHGGLLRKY